MYIYMYMYICIYILTYIHTHTLIWSVISDSRHTECANLTEARWS